MKLIIDISEKTYNKFKNLNQIIGILSFEKDTLDLIKAVKNATPLTESDLVEHAKAIKDYCRQRDSLDDCCEDCQFHFYDGHKGKCIFNYGLYPNEWFNPNSERRTDETDN